jgi:hypothetical protein
VYFRRDWNALRPGSGPCTKALSNRTDPSDAAKAKFLCLENSLEWPWGASDHWVVREKLPGLEEVSFGMEKPRLDVRSEIATRQLDGEDH